VSQKAVGTDARGTTPGPKDARPAATAPRPAHDNPPTSPANALSAALKGFMATLHKQAARNTDVIDVFTRALKDLTRDLRDERMRREILERRLREAEARVEELTRTVGALTRQGWIH
jgi:chromosome segregation ATPase